MTLIKTHDLSIRYGDTTVLRNVTLTLSPGEIVTIVGPNGSGKSSLLKTLIGSVLPASGTITRRPGLRIGYVPQKLHIDPTLPMTVARFLCLPHRHAPDDLLGALEQAGLPDLRTRQMAGLSGGQFQRVLLARAVLERPDLLLLDEATQGLDQPGAAGFYRQIEDVRRNFGCAVVMVSHDLHVVMSASDRVICLNGHVCCQGKPDVVASAPEYRALFGPGTGGALALYRHEHDHVHDANSTGGCEHDAAHSHDHHPLIHTSQPMMLDPFLLRAVLAGIGIALTAAPLGCFVVWRRMAYFGDATAHASILGVALALALSLPVFTGALAVAFVMAVLVTRLSGRGVAVDTALGVMAHASLAFGLVAVTFIPNLRLDLMSYLFGDILAVTPLDVSLIWVGAAGVLTLLIWRWQPLLTATLSPDLAQAGGTNPKREELCLTLALALTVAVAIKVVGVLLIAAMLVIPAAAARPLAQTPERMAIFATLIAVAGALGGIALSFQIDSPTGPSIVCCIAIAFALTNLRRHDKVT